MDKTSRDATSQVPSANSSTRDEFEREARAAHAFLSNVTAPVERLKAFGAIGRYCAIAGLDDPVVNELLVPGTACDNDLVALDTTTLETAAQTLLERAPLLALGDLDAASRDVLDATHVRHDIELVLLGYHVARGSRPKLSPEQRASVLAFDALVEPEIWRLVPLNETRLEERLCIHRSFWNQFWWWCKGASLPSSAVEQLACGAELLQCFPEARESFTKILGLSFREEASPSGSIDRKIIRLDEERVRRSRDVENRELAEVVGMEMPLCRLLFVDADIGCAVWLRGSDCLQVSFIKPPQSVPALRLAGTTLQLSRIEDRTFELCGFAMSAARLGEVRLILGASWET